MEAISKEEVLYELYKFGFFHRVFFDMNGNLIIQQRVGFWVMPTFHQFNQELNITMQMYKTNIDEVYKKALPAINALSKHIFSMPKFNP